MIRSSISKFSRQWSRNLYVTGAELAKSAPTKHEPELIDKNEFLKQKRPTGYITISEEANLAPINGVRPEIVKERRIRIYQPAKNAMQSGTSNIGHWQTEFDNKERWENPLMGWTSTGDPLSNLKNEFRTKEEAIAFCEKSGFKWYIAESKTQKPERVKNYGVNFSWNKRTRVSTK